MISIMRKIIVYNEKRNSNKYRNVTRQHWQSEAEREAMWSDVVEEWVRCREWPRLKWCKSERSNVVKNQTLISIVSLAPLKRMYCTNHQINQLMFWFEWVKYKEFESGKQKWECTFQEDKHFLMYKILQIVEEIIKRKYSIEIHCENKKRREKEKEKGKEKEKEKLKFLIVYFTYHETKNKSNCCNHNWHKQFLQYPNFNFRFLVLFDFEVGFAFDWIFCQTFG